MAGCIFMGFETEFALGTSRSRMRECPAERLLAEAMRTRPFLPAHGERGIFLASGGRLYVDCGNHLEYATPECDDPRDLVACYAAGDQLVLDLLASSTTRRTSGHLVFKSNVCYENTEATWAAHESYSVHRPGVEFAAQLLPFLASRIVFTGAGGMDPKFAGIRPCLSPRVVHHVAEVSASSTDHRGVFHLREEPLAKNGWHRVHVLAGDAARSPRAAWLRAGTTALVLALVDAGETPWDRAKLTSAVAAMRDFNADLSLQALSPLARGPALSAMEIQWTYLHAVEARRGHAALPAWADEILVAWRQALEQLASGVAACESRYDWAIKRAIFAQHCAQRGFGPEKLAAWNQVLAEWQRQLLPTNRSVLVFISRLVEPPKDLTCPAGAAEVLARVGSSWEDLAAFARLRAELCEIDLRYSQLGPGSIHASLTAQGLLDQSLPGAQLIPAVPAPFAPPPRGRARVRGELIRELSATAGCFATWTGIYNAAAGCQLPLPEPTLDARPAWIPWQLTENSRPPAAFMDDRVPLEMLARLGDGDQFMALVGHREPDAAAWANFAVMFKNEVNDFRNAERCYRRSLDLAPDVATYHGNYALFLTTCLGRHDEAERHFRRALELAPDDSGALGNFAFYLQNVRRDFVEAERHYLSALRIGPSEDAFVLTNLASLRLVQGRERDAAMLLQRADLESRGRTSPRARLRLSVLRAIIEWLQGRPGTPWLAEIQMMFTEGVAGGPWNATTLEEHVRQRLDGEVAALSCALLRAIGYLADREPLDQFPLWRNLSGAEESRSHSVAA